MMGFMQNIGRIIGLLMPFIPDSMTTNDEEEGKSKETASQVAQAKLL